MTTVRRLIFFLIRYINIFALFIMFLILALQVIARKLLNNPLQWPEEVALIIMTWITFLGAYQCTVEGSHLKMTFLEDKVPTKFKSVMNIMAKTLVLLFLLVTNIWAYPFIQSVGSTLMPITGLPMWIPYGMIWLGCFLMLLEVLVQTVMDISKTVRTFKQDRTEYAKSGGEDI